MVKRSSQIYLPDLIKLKLKLQYSEKSENKIPKYFYIIFYCHNDICIIFQFQCNSALKFNSYFKCRETITTIFSIQLEVRRTIISFI